MDNDNKTQTTIPADILEAIKTADMYNKLEKIGEKYNLLIDQVGQLEVDTRMVMIGKLKSKNYISTISKNLEISTETAEKIAADVNSDVFSSLRESLRKMQEEAEKEVVTPVAVPIQPQSQPQPPKPDISSIEKVGGFTIEKTPAASTSPIYKDTNLNREAVLKDIEDAGKKTSDSGVSLVDHLLKNPVSNVVQTTEVKEKAPQKPPETPKTPPAPQNPTKYVADPYREPIE